MGLVVLILVTPPFLLFGSEIGIGNVHNIEMLTVVGREVLGNGLFTILEELLEATLSLTFAMNKYPSIFSCNY